MNFIVSMSAKQMRNCHLLLVFVLCTCVIVKYIFSMFNKYPNGRCHFHSHACVHVGFGEIVVQCCLPLQSVNHSRF